MQDTLSAQNGTIVTLACKPCLLIDPQSQGVNWITAREGDNGLATTLQSSSTLCTELEDCLAVGRPMLICEVNSSNLRPHMSTVSAGGASS